MFIGIADALGVYIAWSSDGGGTVVQWRIVFQENGTCVRGCYMKAGFNTVSFRKKMAALSDPVLAFGISYE